MKKGTRRKIIINIVSACLFLFSVATISLVGYSLVDKYLENRELSQIRDSKRAETALEDLLDESDYANFDLDVSKDMEILIEFPTK